MKQSSYPPPPPLPKPEAPAWQWALDHVFAIAWRVGLTYLAIYTIYQVTDGKVSYPVLLSVSAIVILVTRVWARYP